MELLRNQVVDILRYMLHIKDYAERMTARSFTLEVTNKMIDGKTIGEIKEIANRKLVVSRLKRNGNEQEVKPKGSTPLHIGDMIAVKARAKDVEPITALIV